MNRAVILFVVLILVAAFQTSPQRKIYTIGDSTVRNTQGAYCGWGSVLQQFFDSSDVVVHNHAMAGRSTRTFMKEGRWQKVMDLLQPGDYVFIQFGHNEGSVPDTTRSGYRGVLKGIGSDSVLLDWGDGQLETVYTYGAYLRTMVRAAKERGAEPILVSMIPRNQWAELGKVRRADDSYGLWARQVAASEQVDFVDLNSITADKYDALGEEEVKTRFFIDDHTHTNEQGAIENARSVVEGLRSIGHPLIQFVR